VREALAERVPVLSARVGGTGVLSDDARLGGEVPVGDADAYVAELEAILVSPSRRAPIDEDALVAVRAGADEPYRLMRELYAGALAQA
jgi:glycosyltransferase involved in cell wall biosynthesis